MARVAFKNVYRQNRTKLFEDGDVRLWNKPSGRRAKAVLQLERRRPDSPSKWDVCWSGVVSFEGNAAVVETLTAPVSKK